MAGTEQGAFYRNASGWVPFAPGTNNLRILDAQSVAGRWLYCAQNEIGWLQGTDGRVEISESPLGGARFAVTIPRTDPSPEAQR